MKKLSVILEELVPQIHHNVTPRRLMGLAKQHGTTRYMIDDKDKIHAAKAYAFTHEDIANSIGVSDTKAEGAISYDKEKNVHYLHASAFSSSPNHPHLEKIRELGALPGKREGDYSHLKVIPKDSPETPDPFWRKRTPLDKKWNWTSEDENLYNSLKEYLS